MAADNSALPLHVRDRRQKVAKLWNLPPNQFVVVGAGNPVPLPGRGDQAFPFKPHPEYFYLTDETQPGAVLTFGPDDGWNQFVPSMSAEDTIWSGALTSSGRPMAEFAGWIRARKGGAFACLGSTALGGTGSPELTAHLRALLDDTRRAKDTTELDRMRKAATVTHWAFRVAAALVSRALTERQLKAIIDATLICCGADDVAYQTIVAAGENAASLHFSSSERRIRDQDVVLIDAGAECSGYVCDVTRTYPSSGEFEGVMSDIFHLVLAVQTCAIEQCVAGREYRDIHLGAALQFTEGLVDIGILRGEPAALLDRDAHALFFPHGIGHLVGLGVRDVVGAWEGRIPSERPGLRHLRTDLPLRPGYVVTIEPGLYFNRVLLQDSAVRSRYHENVNWALVDTLLPLGGVRIEDNVLVKTDGHEILTAEIPKELFAW